MKIFFVIILSLAFSIQLNAKEIKVNSKIDKVTVFRRGAQLFRSAKAYIGAGRSDIVFSHLAMSLNESSIQVSGKGNYTILAVYHRLNYLEKSRQSRRMKEMRDSVEMLAKTIAFNKSDIAVFNDEITLIKANKVFGSQESGYKVSELKAADDFYNKRLKELYYAVLNKQYKNKELEKIKKRLQQQINVLSSAAKAATSEVVVEVIAAKAGNITMEISYLVNNAGWNPEYDIRVKDINKPVLLVERALIRQNTGVDWKNVRLTVSTGNPQRNGNIPLLNTWYLNYGKIAKNSYSYGSYAEAPQPYGGVTLESKAQGRPSSGVKMSKAASSSDYVYYSEGQTNYKYDISIPYNVLSSNKITRVEIRKNKLDATYSYICIPKLDADVFLQAKITGWDELNLTPGQMNIFFEDSYVSKSFLNPRNFSDTLKLSLGRDKSIVVKRVKSKDKNRKSVLGGKNKIDRSWEISIRNSKSKKIHLLVEDQIPLSRNSEIEVTLTEKSGAKLDKQTGKLQWEFDLEPALTKKLVYSYQVKYPKKYYLTNME